MMDITLISPVLTCKEAQFVSVVQLVRLVLDDQVLPDFELVMIWMDYEMEYLRHKIYEVLTVKGIKEQYTRY